ncbi:MAG: Holliday junction resolvase RuvX [Rhodocyclaceae bacterium]|nr:Holliday junction resolvase RuvX [Rhodocyclaceae bacterium]
MPDGGTVLAFDFGTRRIGVAVGELMLGHARPLSTLAAEANETRFAAIGKLIAEWQPTQLVVGLPLSAAGERHAMSERCERFARQLEGRFGLPVVRVDERYSSVEAESRLAARGQDWSTRKDTLDAEAAATILQSYFDERPTPR